MGAADLPSTAGGSPRAGAPSPPGGSTRAARPAGGSRAALALGALGVALTGLAAVGVGARVHARARVEFTDEASRVAAALHGAFALPVEVLGGLAAFAGAAPEVEPAAFRRYVAPALARHPSLTALEWAPVVPAGERAAHEAAARAAGLEGYAVRELGPGGALVPAGPRPRYVPVLLMEPPDPDALGFDLTCEPARRAVVDRAAAADGPTASERFRLVEDPDGVWSVALYWPVRGAPPGGGGDAGAPLRGFAIALFRLRPVAEAALAEVARGDLALALVDASAQGGEAPVLWATDPAASAPPRAALVARRELDYGGRRWAIVVSRAAPGVPAEALAVLAVGVAATALAVLAALARAQAQRLDREVALARRLGQYELTEKLGQGGMGVVYRAHHALLRRPTAVKLLRPGDASPVELARFEREVRLTARLTHPNTIAIYDYGHTPEGVFYYAMELLDGVDLETLVAATGPQPPARVVHLLAQAAGALAEAHGAGMIHRDVKPANLFLCERGGVRDVLKVLDFGLVKDSCAVGDARLTAEQTIVGTPLYMAPESALAPDTVDDGVDLYALGAVGFFLLTGSPPFDGTNPIQVLAQHASVAVPSPSARLGRPVPPGLEALVASCLAKERAARPASAAALHDALEALAPEVGAWRRAEVDAWWRAHGDAVARARADERARQGGGTPSQLALAVALGRKRAAPGGSPAG